MTQQMQKSSSMTKLKQTCFSVIKLNICTNPVKPSDYEYDHMCYMESKGHQSKQQPQHQKQAIPDLPPPPPPLPPRQHEVDDEQEKTMGCGGGGGFDIDECITSTKCGLSQLVENESLLTCNNNQAVESSNKHQQWQMGSSMMNSKSEKFKMTSTLIRQQTRMLIKKGYYQQQQQQQHQTGLQTIDERSSSSNEMKNAVDMCSYCLINTQDNSENSMSGGGHHHCRSHNQHHQPTTTTTSNNYSYTSGESSFETASLLQCLQSDEEEATAAAIEDMTQQYVCIYNYEAKAPVELTLNYSDRVRVVRSTNDDNYYILVQMAGSGGGGKYGFVPKYCLTPLTRFLGI